MIISDLNHLEVVSEADRVEGGFFDELLGINTSQTNYTQAHQSAGAYSQQGDGINVLNPALAGNFVVPVNSKVFSA